MISGELNCRVPSQGWVFTKTYSGNGYIECENPALQRQ